MLNLAHIPTRASNELYPIMVFNPVVSEKAQTKGKNADSLRCQRILSEKPMILAIFWNVSERSSFAMAEGFFKS
jgi:hypothetical protein